MTFSASAKEEIAKLRPRAKAVRLAELSAILHSAGFLQLGGGSLRIRLEMDSHAAAVKAQWLLGSLGFALESELQALEKGRGRERVQSFDVIAYGEGLGVMLSDTGFLMGSELSDGGILPAFEEKDALRRAFLRGAFLGSGYAADPNKSNHMEIVIRSERLAEDILRLMSEYEIHAKRIYRKGSYVIYLKGGEGIADFFGLIGASASVLAYQNIRIMKEIRNNTNRAVNCDTANLNKAVGAAFRQMRAIEIIIREAGLESLSPSLYEATQLRLQYPEATLNELAERSGVGKSGLYHRFSKIEALAKEIEIERGSE